MNIAPEKSVFINCPFDKAFAPLFDAMLFATVCCGFVPRSALESGTVAEPRIDRITRALFASKYSIHDLSRSKGEGKDGWARLNMPLELGIAMARRTMTRTRKNQHHEWFVLVANDREYMRFVSDLAGFDPAMHDGTVETLVPQIVSWLASRPDAIRTPTPKAVLEALPMFQARRRELGIQWVGDVPWRHVLVAAEENMPEF
ncbi:MAG TPA: hypothetical protein VKK31_24550 [Thermoanaerobaculia bacterium]|nr:hypothetical protein [Thermoanaerobaculia bacterium]